MASTKISDVFRNIFEEKRTWNFSTNLILKLSSQLIHIKFLADLQNEFMMQPVNFHKHIGI